MLVDDVTDVIMAKIVDNCLSTGSVAILDDQKSCFKVVPKLFKVVSKFSQSYLKTVSKLCITNRLPI